MMRKLPFELRIPVLYAGHPLQGNSGLIERVHRAGGLGIVDRFNANGGQVEPPAGVPHGVRISLDELGRLDSADGVRLAVLPLEEIDRVAALAPGKLAGAAVPVAVEVGSGTQAVAAEKAGAAALIARGNEGPGRVSETGGLVLLQEVLGASRLPVFLQGGIGLHTAAGASAAGATGVVLDVHLLLAEDSTVAAETKDFLRSLTAPATVVLGESLGTPYRVYSRVATKLVRELRKAEESLSPDAASEHVRRIVKALSSGSSTAFDTDEVLLPLSEDIAVARSLAERFGSSDAIVEAFGRRMNDSRGQWPFPDNSGVAQQHGTRLPVVQGPMAHVSDNADFLAAVERGGALPFLAMGNMPAGIAREALELARDKTGGRFGVGLIGLEVNRHCYEAHLELMKEITPPFAILAAGSVDLARRIEALGTVCYLHCPAAAILAEALSAGLRHFVFEGAESGGHIGSLGSLDLWNANLAELENAARGGLNLGEVTVLLAGGIATGRASAFAAGMVEEFTARGLNVGLQMGTAYLATEEAVATGAITRTYQELAVRSDRTVVIGRTVNTRARAAGSPMAAMLVKRETQRVSDGVPLRERKELYEKDNLGALRLASKGCAIDPSTATAECPVFYQLHSDEQLDRGLYLMGQVVSLLDGPTTIEALHSEIIANGRRIFESDSAGVESESDRSETTIEADQEPIAVVGIGLRLPGADSPERFWDQIISRRSGIVEVPPDRWGNPDFYYHPDPKVPDKSYSRIGGFVTDFVFEPLKYRIPPAVAGKMDRTQQLAVSCTADALEDAGLSPEDLKTARVGIVLGNSMGGENSDLYATRVGLPRTVACLEESLEGLQLSPEAKKALVDEFRNRYLEGLPSITEDSLPGELANVISGRVANVFNLRGPNFTVDAACASSMAAVMNAVAALREGTIDYAITGGVDAAMSPPSFVKFCKIGALSADGSRPFDEGANGFVMGEGAGILVLKRLSDAIRDGDRIYSTILGVGSSSDGRGKGITAPNAAGQERAVQACLESTGVAPGSISLVEAHGTSTPVGDSTELGVLDKIFRQAEAEPGSVGIGSVKSQIGHLKAAAGAAGMIKVILSLHHQTLPPTINVKKPNPCIDWQTSPLFLVTEQQPWPARNESPRRAGVSAFGFGGTNFHIIVQEHVPGLRVVASSTQPAKAVAFEPPRWPTPPDLNTDGEAWVIGGTDERDLAVRAENLLERLPKAGLAALATQSRDEAAKCAMRCGFAARDEADASKKLTLIRDAVADPRKRVIFGTKGIHLTVSSSDRTAAGIAFVFPGQGSQYPYMLRDLAQRFPVVAETLTEADEILASLGSMPVTATLFPELGTAAQGADDGPDPMKDTQFLQPIILTANVAIFRLLEQFNVRPVVCAGHSLGEYAACVAAGVFSFRDGLEAVAVRGREMARVSIADPGLMMSIPADARVVEDVLRQVDGYVVAANKNSPKQTVISGETHAVKQAGELFQARGLEGTILPVSAAFHSGVVAPAREPFMKTLKRLAVRQPSVPVVSNVTGDFYPVGPAAPERIRDLLGKQFAAPVEWVKTLRRFYTEGVRIFVECGPKRVLTNLTLDTLSGEVLALPTNHPKKGGIVQLMETLAALAAEGVAVNWDGSSGQSEKPIARIRPALRVVREERPSVAQESRPQPQHSSHPLEAIMDAEIAEISKRPEFGRFLELQTEPIRSLIKSSYQSFEQNILPMERTVRLVKSERMDFQPVVVSGTAAGLPSDARFPFDRETLDDLIVGRNFIRKVPDEGIQRMLDKNIERLVKGPEGEADLRPVEDASDVIRLAGYFNDEDLAPHYGMDERLVDALDITSRLALAAGIEALRDAGIPLVQTTRTTSTGHVLPDAWALPEPLRDGTGVIFASAFPGLASLVDEVSRETASRYDSGAKKRLIEFYTGLVGRIRDDREREEVTRWFTAEFGRLNPNEASELYSFNRNFLLRVTTLGAGQMAQFIKAKGPNTNLDAACASTTQAILLARDWIRTGQAERVLVVAADDVAGRSLLPWIGSGFLALGAATANANLSEAALPFDDRRNGLILGSAAVGVVVEKRDQVQGRGMDPIASIECGAVANSAYHGTRLDVDHIARVMERMISRWEEQSGRSRHELAEDVFFMSHETYSPKRGGSASAEVHALRSTFGDKAQAIPIANTKGFTGHTMGVGVEDVTALRCLQKGMLPPIANLKQPDPDFVDMNLSRGGACKAHHVLRLAAGFGSQIVMALYKLASSSENRVTDLHRHREWLKEITSYSDPVVTVEQRTLRVADRSSVQPAVAAESRIAVVQSLPSPVVTGDQPGEDAVKEKVLALLSNKTGYPADMLDLDLDLEADLGIDTVKQAEVISEVREMFGIPRIEGLKIADFPTIKHIIRFVIERTGQTGTAAAPSGEAPAHVEQAPRPGGDVRLFETRLVVAPPAKPLTRPEVDTVIVAGGLSDMAEITAAALSAAGYVDVRRIDRPAIPANLAGRRLGVVNLFGLDTGTDCVRDTFQLLIDCAKASETGPAFLVTAVSEDGAFGFEHPSEPASAIGGVTGASKAFAREFPDTRVRVLDLHPEIPPIDRAAMIVRSLEQDTPVETAIDHNRAFKAVRLVPCMGEPGEPDLRAGDVVLVTGGARGITAACLSHMAERQALTFVVVGRTTLSARAEQLAGFTPDQWELEKNRIIERMKRSGTPPTPVMVQKELSRLQGEAEVYATIRGLRSLGSEVIYRAVDVRDADGVDRVVQDVGELCKQVDVVVHAAGIDRSRALRSKSLDEMEAVFSVKIDGIRNVLEALARHGLPPRRVIGFGSVAGRFGNIAQVDYSAANDGLAHFLRRSGRELDARVSIIDWAPWAEVGMATRGSVQQTLEAAGIDFIPPERGAELFAAALAREGGPCELLAAGRLGPFAGDAFGDSSDGVEEVQLAGQRAKVESLVPGAHLKAVVSLNPSHPLLDHHRIDRAAVLPGVGGMEIMRSAVRLVESADVPLSFEDVRFRSPVKIFKNEPLEVEVELVKLADESRPEPCYAVKISSWLVDREGRKVGQPRVHHEARVVVGVERPPVPRDSQPWRSRVWIAAADLYEIFFHGPGFQFLDHVLVDGKGAGVRFRFVDTTERPEMFTDAVPAAVEAIFQAAAAFGVESRGVMPLPTGSGSVIVHDAHAMPATGELLLVSESSLEAAEGRKVLTFDGAVRDPGGRVILSLSKVEMVELERAEAFHGRIFEEILPVEEVASAAADASDEFLTRTLSQQEVDELRAKTVPKRASEWLAGRVALKQSISRLLAAAGSEPPETSSIEIAYDDNGKPLPKLPDAMSDVVGHVSLAHSNGLAMAAAAAMDGLEGLGVDVEKVEIRSDSWMQDYFTEEEMRAAGTGDRRWIELTRMWCLKEAALKAMGTGLRFDLKEIDASVVDAAGRCDLRFTGAAADHLQAACCGSVEARVEDHDSTVTARVLIRKGSEE